MVEVLVVDDSPAIRSSVTIVLKAEGMRATEAASAEDALAQLRAGSTKPNLMIVDLNMPGMNGIELIKKVRAMPGFRFVPILMMTTESQQTKRAEAKAAGATGWLVKPVPPVDLLRVVKQVCPAA